MHKHFSKRDHQKYDEVARNTAKAFWSKLGWDIEDNPDEYGVDLIAQKDSKRVYVEVEVKRGWHGPTFQYDTMHLPARKATVMDKPTQLMAFTNSLTHADVNSDTAVQKPPTHVVTKHKHTYGAEALGVHQEK